MRPAAELAAALPLTLLGVTEGCVTVRAHVCFDQTCTTTETRD